MTKEQEQAVRRHGENLQAIFPVAREMDAVELCRKLRVVEVRVNNAAARWSNGKINEKTFDNERDRALGSLDRLLRFEGAEVPVFVNSDPRGYALKIKSEWVHEHNVTIHRDMGGYGILAPEFGKDGH